jgi:hypothetical protein
MLDMWLAHLVKAVFRNQLQQPHHPGTQARWQGQKFILCGGKDQNRPSHLRHIPYPLCPVNLTNPASWIMVKGWLP